MTARAAPMTDHAGTMSEHLVHPNAVRQLHAALERMELPADAVFRRASLRLPKPDSDARAPRAAFLAAKAAAAEIAGDPCLGFRLGAHTRLENFDVWGAAVQHASDLHTALRLGSEHAAAWEDGTNIEVSPIEGARLRIRYSSHTPASALGQIIDAQQSIVFLVGVARSLLGPNAPLTAGFACPPPVHDGCAAPTARCRFHTRDWYLEVPDVAPVRDAAPTHPALHAALELALVQASQRAREPDGVLHILRRTLRAHLATGPTLGSTAAALGTSPRALQAHLQQIGSSFTDELAAARLEVARDLLARPGASVKEVAHAVGYSGTAPFSRFLKRATGRSPSTIREPGGS